MTLLPPSSSEMKLWIDYPLCFKKNLPKSPTIILKTKRYILGEMDSLDGLLFELIISACEIYLTFLDICS